MTEAKRAQYTVEFKMEAVRLVRGGQAASVTAKVLGIPKQTKCMPLPTEMCKS
jgi:transposase-like protein